MPGRVKRSKRNRSNNKYKSNRRVSRGRKQDVKRRTKRSVRMGRKLDVKRSTKRRVRGRTKRNVRRRTLRGGMDTGRLSPIAELDEWSSDSSGTSLSICQGKLSESETERLRLKQLSSQYISTIKDLKEKISWQEDAILNWRQPQSRLERTLEKIKGLSLPWPGKWRRR